MTHGHADLVERGPAARPRYPAPSVDASNKAANTVVFMEASLLGWVLCVTGNAA